MDIKASDRQAILKDFEKNGIVVNGCLIKAKTIYTIADKTPSAAPDVYMNKLGSEKEKLPGIGNSVTFGTYNDLYDTGFHPSSYVFTKMKVKSYEEKEVLAKKLFVIFGEPIAHLISPSDREKLLDPIAYEFFERTSRDDKYFKLLNVKITDGLQFDTNNPKDRFLFYIAVLADAIVEKGTRTKEERMLGASNEIDIIKSNAQYTYKQGKTKNTRQDELLLAEIKATESFSILKYENRDVLVKLLNYAIPNVSLSIKDDDDVVRLSFNYQVLNHTDKYKRIERFNKFYQMYQEDKGKLENIFTVHDILVKNKSTFLKEGKVVVDNKTLGSLKAAPELIIQDELLFAKVLEAAEE